MTMLTRYLLFIFIFCVCALPAYAQLEATHYFEIPLTSHEKDNFEFQFFPMQAQGVILLHQETTQYGKTQEINITHLDTAMQAKFSKKILLSSYFNKHVVWQDDQRQNLYGLAQETDYGKKFQFFHLDLATQAGKTYDAEFPFTFEIGHFQVSQQMVYIAGKSDGKWVVVTFNLLDNSIKLLPHFFEDREEIKEIYHDSTRHELLFVMANTDHRKRSIWIQPYSSLIGSGKRLTLQGRSRELRKRSFMEAVAFHPDKQKNDVWTIGAYSFEGQPFWQGLFVTKFEGEEQKSLTFFRFQDFANFFKHFPERRRKKLENKMLQYNEKDQEYTFGRRMLWQPRLIETPNTWVLVFTGYHLQHPNNNNNAMWQSTNTFRNPYPYPYYNPTRFPSQNSSSNMVYAYDYTAMAGFDKQSGRLLWDNMMKVEDIEHNQPQSLVQTGFLGDSIITAYIKEDKLYSQICSKRALPAPPQIQELKMLLGAKLVDKTEDVELRSLDKQYFVLASMVRHTHHDTNNNQRYGFLLARLRYNPPLKEDKKAKN